jgi:prephenate dehydrogenase
MSNLLIVGSEGRMGKWFYKYFKYLNKKGKDQNTNYDLLPIVNFYLIDTQYQGVLNSKRKRDVYTSAKIKDFINKADLIVFCTPTKVTLDLITTNKRLFRSNCQIIEISSLKEIVHNRLQYLSSKPNNLNIISVHPMFGPGASLDSNKNTIIYVPINKSKKTKDLQSIESLFPNFKIATLDSPSEHDTLISLMISLIYFINLIYARIILHVSNSINPHKKNVNINKMKGISGSSFKIQTLLTESIMTDDNSLFLSLLLDSPKSLKLIKEYGRVYHDMVDLLDQKDNERLTKIISQTRNGLMDEIDISESYNLLYKFINK